MKISLLNNDLSYKPIFPDAKSIKTRGIINNNSIVIIWWKKALIIVKDRENQMKQNISLLKRIKHRLGL